ncbi:hypothetical protein [Allobranchiibius sp. GilTou73]|uniref:hypothetical protein n=1 Tax=Allobranchiibius sp. GilTou73 TaxID=2904523 RepID=UPI001F3C7093|nr:hypothetical protein [Allobranchiibius sp. GilTou73]UIJ33962.1 hypothetical protein LVQ62_12535 [Allobranchiibius sp. GilTou73]
MTQQGAVPTSAADQPVKRAVFLVRDTVKATQSYTWRIWTNGTSFYLMPRYLPVSGFKVSLHGPRDAASKPLWKIAVDWEDRDAAIAAGGVALYAEEDYRHDFKGRTVRPGVRHAVRLRFPWKSFHRGSPPGPHPGNAKQIATSFHAVLRPPTQMQYLDVDIYVSDTGKPYWPHESDLIRDRAQVAWLVNDIGQHLTAVSWSHGLNYPTPETLGVLPAPTGPDDAIRAIGACVDRDLLWIQEQVGSRRVFDGRTFNIQWLLHDD